MPKNTKLLINGESQSIRIPSNYISTIVKTAKQLLGENSIVWLFGSRTDESKTGGDIDLLLETDLLLENRAATASRYAALLQQKLGEQKFDILLVDPNTPPQSIFEIAKETGIRL